MKIAIINKVISPQGGGAERYAIDLIHHLCKAGHEIHAIAHKIEAVPTTVSQHLIDMPQRGWRKILVFSNNVRRCLAQHKFDIVYTLTQTVPTDIYFLGGGIHSQWLKIKYPHLLWRWLRIAISPSHWAQLWLEHQLFNSKHCQFMISNSELIKQQAVKTQYITADKIAVIHNGIDTQRFNPTNACLKRQQLRTQWQLSEHDIAICFAAHDFKRKGLATLIEAVGRLGDASQRFHIIVLGRHHKKKTYEQLAAQLKIEQRLHFMGPVLDPEFYYGASDIFVLPSRYEPCSSVVLEAMACGIPAITTALNGACELIQPSQTGFIFADPFDSETLSQFLIQLLDDTLRQRLGQQAAVVMAQQTFTQVVEKTMHVMQQMREILNIASIDAIKLDKCAQTSEDLSR